MTNSLTFLIDRELLIRAIEGQFGRPPNQLGYWCPFHPDTAFTGDCPECEASQE